MTQWTKKWLFLDFGGTNLSPLDFSDPIPGRKRKKKKKKKKEEEEELVVVVVVFFYYAVLHIWQCLQWIGEALVYLSVLVEEDCCCCCKISQISQHRKISKHIAISQLVPLVQ